ncbi:MAG: 23S rRNA (pseudouridine(1915)-N(3))-methyltransferase RlmH [Saprospiraceae bacterium]|nr:23S rRNA (pseudouridine(1915)-N(3))-methyltransferase RlmH [Saprospiraceae bacterium]
MKVIVYSIGKTNESYLREGIKLYLERLKHYSNLEVVELKDVKPQANAATLMQLEGAGFLSQIQKDDYVVLLDERGDQMDSVTLSRFIEKQQVSSIKRLVFIIGGAFGVDDQLRERSDKIFSMSSMTFSHQMIRLFLLEQLYRAFTIIRGEKYHNP